jgi:hypothetical protein
MAVEVKIKEDIRDPLVRSIHVTFMPENVKIQATTDNGLTVPMVVPWKTMMRLRNLVKRENKEDEQTGA